MKQKQNLRDKTKIKDWIPERSSEVLKSQHGNFKKPAHRISQQTAQSKDKTKTKD
jgi:hypothetical protein